MPWVWRIRTPFFWDRDLRGFGVRVYATGRKVYVVQTRGPNGPKRVSLGLHGEISRRASPARRRLRSSTVSSGAKTRSPAPPKPEITVAGLAERYLRAHVAVHCKASTTRLYRGVLDNHILPELGGAALRAVGRGHVAALHYRLRDTPRMANEAVKVLSKMFSLAEAWNLAPPRDEPVPVGAQVQGQEARALPDGGGVPPSGTGAGCGGGGRLGLAPCHRGDPYIDADRVPA